MKRALALTAVALMTTAGLTACTQEQQDAASDAAGSATSAAASGAEAATSAAGSAANEATSAANDDQGDDQSGDDQGGDDKQEDQLSQFAGAEPAEGVPGEVTGYTPYAEREMQDEGVTEDEVAAVVAAGADGTAEEVEWDDDGYWEIEHNDIDVDIRPDGVVHEVDR